MSNGIQTVCVADLLPHTAPMVLIEQIIKVREGGITAKVVITDQSRFVLKTKGVPSYVGLEYMAQTCGLYAGVKAREANQPIQLGFLLGTRNFETQVAYFELGQELFIEAAEVLSEAAMAVFDCQISQANNILASAQLSLYRPPGDKLKPVKT